MTPALQAEIEADFRAAMKELEGKADREFESFWTQFQATEQGAKVAFMRTIFGAVYKNAYLNGASEMMTEVAAALAGTLKG